MCKNILNEPINIYALDVNGFIKNVSGLSTSQLLTVIPSYVKYMGYTHALILNSDHSALKNELDLCKVTDEFHSYGIKVFIQARSQDITDKNLYITSLKNIVISYGIEGVFFDQPILDYCDTALIKEANDTIHAISSSMITITTDEIAAVCSDSAFDLVVNSRLFNKVLDYVSIDPYFRKYSQQDFEFSLFSSKNNNIVSLSCLNFLSSFKSVFLNSYGSFRDKLDQKRAIDLLLLSIRGKKLTLMGGEFAGDNFEAGAPNVDWRLLETQQHLDLRSYTRALNTFYLATPIFHSSEDGVELAQFSGFDNSKNVIALTRTSKDEKIMTVVNLSGIEQSIDVQSDGNTECIFATSHRLDNSSVVKSYAPENIYTITLPAFSGAVYRLK